MRPWILAKYAGLALVLALSTAAPTHAGTVKYGNGWSLTYLLNLTYSMAVRTEEKDPALVAGINGDDGDRNFDQGSLFTNRIAALGELRIEKGDYGVFLRGSAFYDLAYASDENDNVQPQRLNYRDKDGFPEGTENRLGKRARLLDAYVYGTWFLGDTSLSVKLGNQVVAWGQSLYFPNMSGLMAPSDATKSNIPGTSVKQILLPTEQIYVQWGLTRRLSLAAFYQFDYDTTELPPVGSYFSSTDVVGPGSQFIIAGPFQIPKGDPIRSESDGQWGIRTTYRIGLGTIVGLHYLNMHSKNPTGVRIENGTVTGLTGGTAVYHPFYASDIDMYALTLATGVTGVAIGAELSFREGAGVSVPARTLLGRKFPTPTTAEFWQANVNATKVIGPSDFWDRLVLVGEIAGTSVGDIDPYEYGGKSYDELADGSTGEAAAFTAEVRASYEEVFPGWDMTVTLSHENAFYGTTAVVSTLGSLSGEGDRRYGLNLGFEYLGNLTLGVGYNYFVGDPGSGVNALADRSFASFSAKYSF